MFSAPTPIRLRSPTLMMRKNSLLTIPVPKKTGSSGSSSVTTSTSTISPISSLTTLSTDSVKSSSGRSRLNFLPPRKTRDKVKVHLSLDKLLFLVLPKDYPRPIRKIPKVPEFYSPSSASRSLKRRSGTPMTSHKKKEYRVTKRHSTMLPPIPLESDSASEGREVDRLEVVDASRVNKSPKKSKSPDRNRSRRDPSENEGKGSSSRNLEGEPTLSRSRTKKRGGKGSESPIVTGDSHSPERSPGHSPHHSPRHEHEHTHKHARGQFSGLSLQATKSTEDEQSNKILSEAVFVSPTNFVFSHHIQRSKAKTRKTRSKSINLEDIPNILRETRKSEDVVIDTNVLVEIMIKGVKSDIIIDTKQDTRTSFMINGANPNVDVSNSIF